MTKKKKKKSLPKPRHVWKINPKSRVKKSDKTYSRKKKKKEDDWLDTLGWFEE